MFSFLMEGLQVAFRGQSFFKAASQYPLSNSPLAKSELRKKDMKCRRMV